MEFRTFAIEGPLELVPRKIEDARGYFSETFRLAAFTEHAGPVGFVQDNQSLSVRTGTIRGIHFQSLTRAQGKLVRCLSGSLLDVAVDLRTGSPTYGQWIAVTLTPEQNNQLWIPRVLHVGTQFRHRLPGHGLLQPRERQGRRLGRSKDRHRLAQRGGPGYPVGQGS